MTKQERKYLDWCKENGGVFTKEMHEEILPFPDAPKTRHNVSFKNNYLNPSANYYTKSMGKTHKAKI